eukprot:6483974-Amphidinium_carterae.2
MGGHLMSSSLASCQVPLEGAISHCCEVALDINVEYALEHVGPEEVQRGQEQKSSGAVKAFIDQVRPETGPVG